MTPMPAPPPARTASKRSRFTMAANGAITRALRRDQCRGHRENRAPHAAAAMTMPPFPRCEATIAEAGSARRRRDWRSARREATAAARRPRASAPARAGASVRPKAPAPAASPVPRGRARRAPLRLVAAFAERARAKTRGFPPRSARPSPRPDDRPRGTADRHVGACAPSSRMLPDSAGSRPAISRRSEVLPAPFGPVTTTASPAAAAKERPRRGRARRGRRPAPRCSAAWTPAFDGTSVPPFTQFKNRLVARTVAPKKRA